MVYPTKRTAPLVIFTISIARVSSGLPHIHRRTIFPLSGHHVELEMEQHYAPGTRSGDQSRAQQCDFFGVMARIGRPAGAGWKSKFSLDLRLSTCAW